MVEQKTKSENIQILQDQAILNFDSKREWSEGRGGLRMVKSHLNPLLDQVEYILGISSFQLIIFKQMGVRLSFMIILALLLARPQCIDWQGTGNMPPQMMTAIWNYINTIDVTLPMELLTSSSSNYLMNFAIGFSNHLDDQFDKAWNVVLAYRTPYSDTVVYGYAFREHWFWYNGFKMTDGSPLSFIIWKDYNCQTYLAYNINANILLRGSTFYATQTNNLKSFTTTQVGSWRFDDVWKSAYDYVENLQKSAAFQNSVFSIVLTQYPNLPFYANVCALNYYPKQLAASNGKSTGSNLENWGAFLLFEMRKK